MAETPSSNLEQKYTVSTSKILKQILIDNGLDQKNFKGVDIPKFFPERELSKEETAKLATLLNGLKTEFEKNSVINAITRNDLIDKIGTTYTFANLDDIEKALEQQKIIYPDKYLEQKGSTFQINFNAPRTLSKEKYNKLITDLQGITGKTPQDNIARGEIIRAAFNEIPTPVFTKREIATINNSEIQNLKTVLDNENSKTLTVLSLNTTLEKLKDEKNPDNRAVVTSYIWSKLNSAGYTMIFNAGSVELNHKKDSAGAVELQTAIQSNITANIISISDLQRAMIVGPSSFGKYLETQTATPSLATTAGFATFLVNKLSIDLSKGTPSDQIRRINSSKGNPEEKAFLVSYVNGGFKGYDIAPEIQRQIAISKVAAETKASPASQAVVAQVNRVSGGGTKAEAVKMKEANEELTWNSFLDNPMSAIAKYPWTSLGIVLTSMYKFGFMKTLLGMIGGFIGYKVVDEFGGIDAMKTGEKKATPSSNSTQNNRVSSVLKMDHTIDISKKGPLEQKLWNNLQKTSSIINTLDNRSERLSSYMSYIDQNNILTKALGDLIYTNPYDQSIFSNKLGLPTVFPTLPAGMDPIMLKRILRVLISGTDRYSAIDPDGINHTKAYKIWVLGASDAPKIGEPDWKNKKITDIIPDIAKKF